MASTTIKAAMSGGYTAENVPAFYLRERQDNSGTLAALYLCQRSTHEHFLTTDSACEAWGSAARQYPLGYIGTTPALSGSTTLYRLRKNDHLYTTSKSELMSAKGWP